MVENRRVTATDIKEFYELSSNIVDSKIDPHILRAQRNDLEPFLGAALYRDFQTNFSDAKYVLLWDGEEYSYNNETIIFRGIRPLLCAWAYKRFISNGGLYMTRKGLVSKLEDNSEREDNNMIASRIREVAEEAIKHAEDAVKYLDEKVADHPLWQNSPRTRPKSGLKITVI